MTREDALKEYDNSAKSVKDNHLAELPKKTLNANEQSKAINKFFGDFDAKCDSKEFELLKKFPSLDDKFILKDCFIALRGKHNEDFKSIVMNWNSANENNPTE